LARLALRVRICSLSPFATDVICALGSSKELVAISEDGSSLPGAAGLPVVAKSMPRDVDALGSFERAHEEGWPLYRLDLEGLLSLSPSVIITQDICPVCYASSDAVFRALRARGHSAKIFPLEAKSIREGLEGILQLGRLLGKASEAQSLVRRLRARSEEMLSRTLGLSVRPKVLCLEWPYPPYAAGFWVPEAIYLAGGEDGVGLPGKPHFRVLPAELERYEADVVLVAARALGFDELKELLAGRGAAGLMQKALGKAGRYLLDARRLLSSPGPMLYEAIELLSKLLHPRIFGELSEEERSAFLYPMTDA
jgi:iron complex transport system substrate-binding protein